MDHPCLKYLNSLYHIHLWMESDPFVLSQQLHLQKAKFFLIVHLQCLSECHFTKPCRKSLSQLTVYISILVLKKMAKIYISFKKSEGTMHSGNSINPSNKTCCKILVWINKINIHNCKIIISSSIHSVFSWVYNSYKSFLVVETDDILMTTQNILCFEILTQEFYTLFDYTFQERSKLKLLNINIIQSKYSISIYQTDHITENII